MNTTRMDTQHASASEDSLAVVATTMKARGKPIRLRLPLQLWTGKVYTSWKQEVWKVEVADAQEARRLRGVLEKLFTALGRAGGVEVVERQLDALLAFQPETAAAAGDQ